MADVTAQEQLMLELVNRARMDPDMEAARFGMTLNQGLPPGTITNTPKQALAMNDTLVTAADNHSEYMHLNDDFSHQEVPGSLGFTGVNPSDRLIAAGYNGATSQGENIAWYGVVPTVDLTVAIIAQHEGLFRSTTGHRQNLLSDNWREVGIGQERGSFFSNGIQYDSSLVTQNFAYRGVGYFLTGVIYQDTIVNDDFYTIGEGQGGVGVGIDGGFADVSSAAGGYEAAMAAGAHTVTIGAATVQLTMAGRNIKLDFVNGNQLWTDTSLTLVSGAGDVRLLGATNANLTGSGGSEQLVGNRANNTLTGGTGNDVLFGLAGNDTLNGNGNNDFLDGGAGSDTLNGGIDNDTYQLGSDATGVDTLSDSSGVDTVRSTITRSLQPWAFIEHLILDGADNINGTGNGSANNIFGNIGNNFLTGQGGSDGLLGGGGNDWLYGQAGLDRMKGEAGNDRFALQSVNDSLPGAANRDWVYDFDKNGDDLFDFTAVPGITTFIGVNAFTAPGQVRVRQAGADIVIELNTVGNSVAEAEVLVLNTTIGNGVNQLNGGDFLL